MDKILMKKIYNFAILQLIIFVFVANGGALNPAPARYLRTLYSQFSIKDLTTGLDVTRCASVHSSVLTCENFFSRETTSTFVLWQNNSIGFF